jgi:ABC-type glycerol-3-phosphate transport system substrate-binding protein
VAAARRDVQTRRALLGAGAGVAAGTLAAACRAPGLPGQTQRAAPAGPAVEILVQSRSAGSGVSEVEYWQKILGRFNDREPRLHATFEAFPPDKGPQVLAAAGSLGDVVRVGGWGGEFPGLAVGGHLRDLTSLIQRDHYDLKQFYAASIESLRLRGKQLGLPHTAHPGFSGHYVNLDALAQAGIPQPNDAIWRHADLVEIGKRLANAGRSGDGGGWAMWPPTQLQHVLVAARAYGGDLLSRDGKQSLVTEPQTEAGLQFVADLIVKDRAAPAPGALPGTGVSQFIQGNVAILWWNMFVIGTLKQQAQGLRWKVFLTPLGPTSRGVFMTTDTSTMGAGTKAPDQAFEVLKYTISQECNFDWFDMTGNPGGQVAFWTDKRATDDPAISAFARAIAESTPLHYVDNGLGDEYNQVLDKTFATIWSGTASVKDAAETARRAGQEIIDRPVAAG